MEPKLSHYFVYKHGTPLESVTAQIIILFIV